MSLKKPPSRAAWDRRRAELHGATQGQSFPLVSPRENSVRDQSVEEHRRLGGAHGYADYKDVSFQTEEGVRIRAQLFTPNKSAAGAPLLIYVKRAGDSFYFMDLDELLPLLGRYTVLILNPRFTEQSMSPADYADIERTAAWSGRTIAAMQVWDILRAVEWVTDEEKLSASSISLYGKGEMGILALYAALFDRAGQASHPE